MARIIELIQAERTAGSGKDETDPIRRVAQLWTKEGALIAEHDTWSQESFFHSDAKVVLS